ncbi:MAG TPA: N-acetyltransferase [Thermodesulfobacteriota bacterium]|nr:N-acetyltransferase [Thermodesulfobacteriota bacterium]
MNKNEPSVCASRDPSRFGPATGLESSRPSAKPIPHFWLKEKESFRRILAAIGRGDVRTIVSIVIRRLYSDENCVGLRRDLALYFQPPESRKPICIRPLREEDLGIILDTKAPGVTKEGLLYRERRRKEFQAGVKTCYVAATADGDRPCYLQWLIGPEENAKLQALFEGEFPVLRPGEMIMERAFTLEPYRGCGIMASAMARIAEKGKEAGGRWVMTFVDEDNIAALKGCHQAGFEPFLIRKEKWRLFRRSFSFEALPGKGPEAPGAESFSKPSRPEAGSGR